jgi:hypothetical protein
MGIVREPTAGYDVGSRSFYLWVDDPTPGNPPVQHSVSFTASNKTLAEVISAINTAVGSTVAYDDNGFLKLISPRTGRYSYLRVQTDGTSSPTDVLFNLGLFAETESFGGDPVGAPTIDPGRQVATPNQLSAAEGESITSRVFNRLAMQLAVNLDHHEGILSKKPAAVQREVGPFVYSTPAEHGYQFSGGDYIYVGEAATSFAQEKAFVVLDIHYREFTKETETIDGSATDGTMERSSGVSNTLEVSGTGLSFSSADVTGNRFIRVTDLVDNGDGEDQLNDKLLKITGLVSSSVVVVAPVDSDTGDIIDFGASQTNLDIEKVIVEVQRCRVKDVKDAAAGSSVAAQELARSGMTAVTDLSRVEKTNRLVIDSVSLGTDFVAAGVVPGDKVTWANHVGTTFNNNGDYVVSQVIDKETIELVAEDWSPVFLNTDLGTPGDITITSDGKFYQDPFVVFDPNGAVPDDGDSVRILYLEMSSFKEASNDPTFLSGGGLRYDQEADDSIQEAILSIIGPSAQSVDEFLFDDARNSLEGLDVRLKMEHYPYGEGFVGGRHKDIRPDTIDMFDEVDGVAVKIRKSTGDASSAQKLQVIDDDGSTVQFYIQANGHVRVGNVASDLKATNITNSEVAANDLNTSGFAALHANATGTGGSSEVNSVGTATATLKAESEATAADGAILRLISGAALANPLSFAVVADPVTDSLRFDVVNDKAGNPHTGVMEILAGGLVKIKDPAGVSGASQGSANLFIDGPASAELFIACDSAGEAFVKFQEQGGEVGDLYYDGSSDDLSMRWDSTKALMVAKYSGIVGAYAPINLLVGDTPVRSTDGLIHTYRENTGTFADDLLLEQNSTGDVGVTWFLRPASLAYGAGIDNSNNDAWSISPSSDGAINAAVASLGVRGLGGSSAGDPFTSKNFGLGHNLAAGQSTESAIYIWMDNTSGSDITSGRPVTVNGTGRAIKACGLNDPVDGIAMETITDGTWGRVAIAGVVNTTQGGTGTVTAGDGVQAAISGVTGAGTATGSGGASYTQYTQSQLVDNNIGTALLTTNGTGQAQKILLKLHGGAIAVADPT